MHRRNHLLPVELGLAVALLACALVVLPMTELIAWASGFLLTIGVWMILALR